MLMNAGSSGSHSWSDPVKGSKHFFEANMLGCAEVGSGEGYTQV